MKTNILLALGMLSWTALTSACSAPANCPTCGTTQNGTIVAINTMEVPQSSPFGKPFSVWDLVLHVVTVGRNAGSTSPTGRMPPSPSSTPSATSPSDSSKAASSDPSAASPTASATSTKRPDPTASSSLPQPLREEGSATSG